MKLSYEKIRKVHRLEQSSSKLTNIEDDFLDSIRPFLDDEKEEIRKNNDIFDDSKVRRLQNIRLMLEDIIYLRQKKIINNVIMGLKSSEQKDENLISYEEKVYSNIFDIIKDYLSYMELNSTKETKSQNKVQITILKSVPKFIGTDMQEYGPYKEQDLATIPESIAKLLVSKEIAKYN